MRLLLIVLSLSYRLIIQTFKLLFTIDIYWDIVVAFCVRFYVCMNVLKPNE